MKKIKLRRITMLIILLLLIPISIIGIRIYTLSKVSTGEKIEQNIPSKKALLVLDIQNDTVNLKEYTNSDSLIQNINKAVNYAEEKNIDVLYVKQEFSNTLDKLLSGGKYAKNTSGSKLSSNLDIVSSNIYTKEKNDSFSNKELEDYLIQNKITTLYLVGADASACVYKTALAGVNRGFNVIVLEDCIFSVNDKLLLKTLKNYEENNIKVDTLNSFISN